MNCYGGSPTPGEAGTCCSDVPKQGGPPGTETVVIGDCDDLYTRIGVRPNQRFSEFRVRVPPADVAIPLIRIRRRMHLQIAEVKPRKGWHVGFLTLCSINLAVQPTPRRIAHEGPLRSRTTMD